MNRKQPAARFVVTLEAPAEIDAIRTLRAALKVLWRRYQLKCVTVREESPAPPINTRVRPKSV
jgi:hypothetical protein